MKITVDPKADIYKTAGFSFSVEIYSKEHGEAIEYTGAIDISTEPDEVDRLEWDSAPEVDDLEDIEEKITNEAYRILHADPAKPDVNRQLLEALKHALHRLNAIPHRYDDTNFKMIEKAIKDAESGAEDPDEISVSWHIDDVIERAKERDIKVTEDEAREILQAVKKHHDASIGINWDVLDIHTENFCTELEGGE